MEPCDDVLVVVSEKPLTNSCFVGGSKEIIDNPSVFFSGDQRGSPDAPLKTETSLGGRPHERDSRTLFVNTLFVHTTVRHGFRLTSDGGLRALQSESLLGDTPCAMNVQRARVGAAVF